MVTQTALTTADATKITVVIDAEEHVIQCIPGASILESMRDAGLNPPSSCEAGQCGTCLAALKTGTVKMETTTALSDEDIEDGLILTCQARPTSNRLHVDFDDI
jgi:ring-1,2-phenylacetyl-CoA epoxidase subunit PaaE